MVLCTAEAVTIRLPLHLSKHYNTTEVLRLHFAILYEYFYNAIQCNILVYHATHIQQPNETVG